MTARTFNSPQCPHCAGYAIDNEYEYNAAMVEFGDADGPVTLECPECEKHFEVMEEDVIGEHEW